MKCGNKVRRSKYWNWKSSPWTVTSTGEVPGCYALGLIFEPNGYWQRGNEKRKTHTQQHIIWYLKLKLGSGICVSTSSKFPYLNLFYNINYHLFVVEDTFNVFQVIGMRVVTSKATNREQNELTSDKVREAFEVQGTWQRIWAQGTLSNLSNLQVIRARLIQVDGQMVGEAACEIQALLKSRPVWSTRQWICKPNLLYIEHASSHSKSFAVPHVMLSGSISCNEV